MNNDDLRDVILKLIADAFPREVWRREIDRALAGRAEDKEILAGLNYLHDEGGPEFVSWRKAGHEWAYSLTAAGCRATVCCDMQTALVAGNVIELLFGQYPHHVSDKRLTGALLAKLGMSGFDRERLAKALRYLEISKFVLVEDEGVKLAPLGVDLVDGALTDEGVTLL
jgi:hypothetical protein